LDETRYLSAEDVVALHDDILDRMGSPFSPVLDNGKLDSAVARCRNAAHYEEADLIRQAVLLAVAISQSQAFLDGNKRAAYYAADVFLRINGQVYIGPPLEMALHLEAIAIAQGDAREARVNHFERWLRGQVVSDTPFSVASHRLAASLTGCFSRLVRGLRRGLLRISAVVRRRRP
jgi:death on curing protein